MMTTASELNQRVRIEQRAVTDDSYGGQNVTWTELATVFARVEPVYSTLSENEIADQLDARAGYRIKIRTRTDVNASMRIVWKTHTLTIHSLHEMGDVLSILTYEEDV